MYKKTVPLVSDQFFGHFWPLGSILALMVLWGSGILEDLNDLTSRVRHTVFFNQQGRF